MLENADTPGHVSHSQTEEQQRRMTSKPAFSQPGEPTLVVEGPDPNAMMMQKRTPTGQATSPALQSSPGSVIKPPANTGFTAEEARGARLHSRDAQGVAGPVPDLGLITD